MESATDLAERHGVRSMSLQAPVEAIARAYGHIAESGVFRVAEADGRVVALACAIVRGPWWFLSGFWVRPGMQGQGIGGPLLDEVVREGERAGARAFFTWSSVDPRAVATYLRRGFLPGWPMLVFAADMSVSRGRAPYEPARGYELAALDPELPRVSPPPRATGARRRPRVLARHGVGARRHRRRRAGRLLLRAARGHRPARVGRRRPRSRRPGFRPRSRRRQRRRSRERPRRRARGDTSLDRARRKPRHVRALSGDRVAGADDAVRAVGAFPLLMSLRTARVRH